MDFSNATPLKWLQPDTKERQRPQHPNIVLFMPETLRADAGFGDPSRRARTPNMDTLGEEGVRFERCYAQHSVCAPSRCSMFTGLYPHTAGRRTLGTLIRPH